MDISERLLTLAASATWDGGDEVIRCVRTMLAELAPFDAGEIAVRGVTGFTRWTLTDDDEPLGGDDLLLHLDQPLRFDNIGEAQAFPRTRDDLARRGFVSLVAIPLSLAGGPEGAVLLARRQGWGFVGVSLGPLLAFVGMTGLSLERALALTALRKRVKTLESKVTDLDDDLETARRDLHVTRQTLDGGRNVLVPRTADRTRVEELEARLNEAEGAMSRLHAELERHRDEATRLGTQCRGLLEERAGLESQLKAMRDPQPEEREANRVVSLSSSRRRRPGE